MLNLGVVKTLAFLLIAMIVGPSAWAQTEHTLVRRISVFPIKIAQPELQQVAEAPRESEGKDAPGSPDDSLFRAGLPALVTPLGRDEMRRIARQDRRFVAKRITAGEQ